MFAKHGQRRGGAAQKMVQQEKEPERILGLKQCCDMLLAGGYFRARIPTLSPFDRVIGGMVWSLTASNAAVDVDIIFQENSTIGQKIKLSESVVRALLKMKCPHRIEPPQIQGLDYDHLFPVLQWLVRKVLETRRLTGDLVRALSVSQFDKRFVLPSQVHPEAASQFVKGVVDTYKPKRLFKKKDRDAFASAEAKTEATLLEYGEKFYRPDPEEDESKGRKGKNKAFSQKRGALMAKFGGDQKTEEEEEAEAEQKRQEEEQKEVKRLAEMQAKLDTVGDEEVSIGGLFDQDQIAQYAGDQEAFEAALDREAAPVGRKGVEASFKRQIDALKRRVEEQTMALQEAKEAFEAKEGASNDALEAIGKKEAYNLRVVTETTKLEEQEKVHPKRHFLPKLKALVVLNESLKKQEVQFKNNCKDQLAEIQGMMARLETAESDDETARMLEIERVYESDLNKLNKLRKLLAKKNQDISRIVRAIDDIPTRAELIQYERRFVELYELVADKLIETRKYYDLYNTLEETHRYMENEVSLLESIGQNYTDAFKSAGGKEQLLDSFGGILENVSRNIVQVDESFQGEKSTRDTLNAKYGKLLEKQRKYFKMVKEFQEECFKNEQYSEALSRLADQAK